MNLVFFSWLFFIIPLIFIFKDRYNINLLYIFGIIMLLSSIIYYSKNVNLKFYIKNIKLTFFVLIIFLTNPGLKIEMIVYLPLAYLAALVVPLSEILKAAKFLISIIIFLVIIQGLFIGYDFYPGSEKKILLLWNPNIFWHYVTGFLILIIFFDKKIPFLYLTIYILGCIFFGFSRGAFIILMITILYKVLINKNFLINLLSYSFILFIILFGFFLLILSDEISYLLIEYDELSSMRISSAFQVSRDTIEYIEEISDIPFIDIFQWGYWHIFLISIFALSYINRKNPQAVVLILLYLLSDSTVYSPIIILIIFILFKNSYLLNKLKSI